MGGLYWIFFAVVCVVNFFIALAIWLVTTPFDRQRRTNHLFSCFWGWLSGVCHPGWHFRVEDRHKIAPRTPYVLVSNHTSLIDTVMIYMLFRQFKWVSKRSVFNVPFMGWNMWLCRYVPLVRGDKASTEQMMQTCRDWLERGISIMMFPEGTRSEDGTVKPFKHGAFTLALDAGVAVVPIAIHGGHLLLPKHRKAFASTARCRVQVLDPIPPGRFDSAASYGQAARNAIRAALGQSVAE